MAEFIGQVFAVWDHIATNDYKGKVVRLTAGQSGSGGFNNGLINNESVSGSQPTLTATAIISTGPLAGQTIRLINTERSFLRPGSSGTFEQDQLQIHRHSRSLSGNTAFIRAQNQGSQDRCANSGAFATIGNPSGARTSTETRPKNVGISYYLKVL